jgi:hypothetical protein
MYITASSKIFSGVCKKIRAGLESTAPSTPIRMLTATII